MKQAKVRRPSVTASELHIDSIPRKHRLRLRAQVQPSASTIAGPKAHKQKVAFCVPHRTKVLIDVVLQLNAQAGFMALSTFNTATLQVYPIIFVDPSKVRLVLQRFYTLVGLDHIDCRAPATMQWLLHRILTSIRPRSFARLQTTVTRRQKERVGNPVLPP